MMISHFLLYNENLPFWLRFIPVGTVIYFIDTWMRTMHLPIFLQVWHHPSTLQSSGNFLSMIRFSFKVQHSHIPSSFHSMPFALNVKTSEQVSMTQLSSSRIRSRYLLVHFRHIVPMRVMLR